MHLVTCRACAQKSVYTSYNSVYVCTLCRCPKELFFSEKNEEWRQFSNSKHYHKSLKIHPIDTKDCKIQWIGFSGLSAKSEMYFSPTKLKKPKYKHRKTLASATCFHSNVPHIFSYSSKKIRININRTTYNLSSNIKF
jgi:hypothetical protein